MIPIVFSVRSIFDAIWLIVSPIQYGGGLKANYSLYKSSFCTYKQEKLHPLKTI